MPKKQRAALDYAYHCLLACVESHGRKVSAGELAKEMGVSRNTAFARLMDLVEQDVIVYSQYWRGSVSCYVYGFPIGDRN